MKTEGCLRPKTSTISSDIILPVPTSSPLLTEMMGTSAGSISYKQHSTITVHSTAQDCTVQHSTCITPSAQYFESGPS